MFALADKLAASNTAPSADDLKLLQKNHTAVDIAMFGRMLASSPAFNTEAAVQVAHAVTVHDVAVEDDYFTAVDDLNSGEDDLGAAHIGETEFGAGVFYLYLCINRDLLEENLRGKALANKSIAALVEAAAKVAPNGKQNSFASRAYASYILAEKGDQQPRSLSVAFLKPVRGEDVLGKAIIEIESKRANMEKVYGKCAEATKTMNAETGAGSLDEIITFVSE
jgi:CRISPR system Cascade subunit CasC